MWDELRSYFVDSVEAIILNYRVKRGVSYLNRPLMNGTRFDNVTSTESEETSPNQ